ncbi:hypothetical protein OOZ19_15925 [Saccharopolyspora sp. NFXS83]|uniref:hypothetical protein n=1 Tax=Saccharopolyspora sp. NFXS83 TaxID=2993560 RepID=UPI00224B2A28|nr:hypothetical protein [Saccharopolyspora sp. NFXS83]MCX2731730.1 hypothetical protein [Saccharopolyspora sp. NFXS83]
MTSIYGILLGGSSRSRELLGDTTTVFLVHRWEVDERDEAGYPTGAHGEPVIGCVLAERPDATDVVALLKLATSQEQLERWTQTPIGANLTGTAFAATKRYNDDE